MDVVYSDGDITAIFFIFYFLACVYIIGRYLSIRRLKCRHQWMCTYGLAVDDKLTAGLQTRVGAIAAAAARGMRRRIFEKSQWKRTGKINYPIESNVAIKQYRSHKVHLNFLHSHRRTLEVGLLGPGLAERLQGASG